ncbi:MAG TPA: hypothetical protein VN618_08800 [Solirubrobacteraceae bacterium]|nr:hypothetical protein [Solirubrobacteraceae bacterium]
MKRIRVLACCMAATAAAIAVTASSAAALPQFWQGGSPIGAEAKKGFIALIGSATLKTSSTHKILCTEGISSGETNGPNEVTNFGWWFVGCKETISGASCHSTNPLGSEGEIVTFALKGPLGYLRTTAPVKVGLLLNTGEGAITKIQCGTLTGEVKKSVIGEARPINVQQTGWELVFNEAGGNQEWTKFAGETATHRLEAFAEPAVLVTTFTGWWSEELEIRG